MNISTSQSLLAWIISLILITVRIRIGRPTAGLQFSFWFSLAMYHVFTAICYMLSDVDNISIRASIRGFELSGWAAVGFSLGLIIVEVSGYTRGTVPTVQKNSSLTIDAIRHSNWAIIFGGVPYIASLTGYLEIPTLKSIVYSGYYLVLTGVCMRWYANNKMNKIINQFILLLFCLVLPFLSTTILGFIGIGVNFLILISCFTVSINRLRWYHIVGFIVSGYLGICLWTAYSSIRLEFRESMRGMSAEERVSYLINRVPAELRLFDVNDDQHLNSLTRFDQIMLLGYSDWYISSGSTAYARGDTFLDAIFALVPRAIWRDKPSYAGSGTLASDYSGVAQIGETSIALGPIMEAYINFGEMGILVTILVLTIFVIFLDTYAGRMLAAENWRSFVWSFTCCLPLVVGVGNYAELTSGTVALLVLVFIMYRIFPERVSEN